MNRNDYLNKQRYNNQKIIPVQPFAHRQPPIPDNPIRMRRGSWIDRLYRSLRLIGSKFRKVFSTVKAMPNPKIKIALPKQAIQAERDHGHLWGGSL